MKQHKTFMQKPANVNREWHLVDVKGKILGRAATEIAQLLIGKDKPTYTPHIDGGDYVVVINAKDIAVSGSKKTDKFYRWHSGFPGGLKEISLGKMLDRSPEKVIQKAVRNMLPKNKLRRNRMIRLKVYADNKHPHQEQIKEEDK